MRLLIPKTMQMKSLSKRTIANEVANHESNANEAAKDKNTDK